MAKPVRSEEGKKKVREYIIQYQKEHYDSVTFRIPKGQRDILNGYARILGMARNEMFMEAVKEYVERHIPADKRLI